MKEELAEYGIKDVPNADVETRNADQNPSWFDLIEDAAAIATEELPTVVQIIEDILPESCKLVIAGAAKTFKTWITLHVAFAISHGIPFLNHPTTRRRVLYCNLELRSIAFKRRIKTIGKALDIKFKKGCLLHIPLRGKLAGLQPSEVVSRIITLVKELKIEVVILDPTYKLLANADENATGAMTALFNEIDRITTEAHCTVILCDHFSKGNKSESDPLDAIRGSSAKAGDVDAAMIVRPHETKNCFSIDMIHRELAPVEPFVVEWRFPLMTLRNDLDPARMKKAGRKRERDPRKLLAAIAHTTAENPISISAWAKAGKVPRQTLTDYLPAMRREGWITTSGEGPGARQFLTNKGKAFLNETQTTRT